MREPFIITAALLAMAWATDGKADGIAAMLMPADPCGAFAPIIVEADTVAQADLFDLHCGRVPTVAQMVALDANYVPGHPTMHWDQPDPLPSPVPLGATMGYLTVAMLALMAAKRRMI